MPDKKSKETNESADAPTEISELGKKLREIKKQIEADPNIRMLTREEIRQEVIERRGGYNWDEDEEQ